MAVAFHVRRGPEQRLDLLQGGLLAIGERAAGEDDSLATLAGFGGLALSSYRGLRGLGIACLGGVALALLVTQWLLPWALRRWPLQSGHRD